MIIDFLNKNSDSILNNPVIYFDNVVISYREFEERILIATNKLISLGINQGTHVTLISENNLDSITILFSLWNISAVPIPLNIRLIDDELDNLIIHSESEFILVHQNLKKRLTNNSASIRKIIFPLSEDYNNEIPFCENSFKENNTALIIYTSGTTNLAKGVMLSFHNLISSALTSSSHFNFQNNDKWLVSLPLYHIGGIQILFRAIIFGSSVIIPKSLKTEDLINAIVEFKPTQISLVPTTLNRLIEKNISPYSELRNVFLGGGPSDEILLKRAIELGWNVIKVYGSTETSSMVTSVCINENPEKINSSGKSLGSNIIKIVDDKNNRLPQNQTGEIVVCGNSVMQGYWNDPEETNKRSINNEYFTSDIGYLDSDGYLYIDSRRDDIIISGGENINPTEIEQEIFKYPNVREVCVVGLKDNEWGQIVAAAIVPITPEKILSADLLKFLKCKLAGFKLPKQFLVLQQLPKTQLGKIKREEVRLLFEDNKNFNF
ncbi:MAG: o-succinylbenzoate--CoA ligase [Ignavibacteriales bacterium]|nr:o-succinylbenzoate--CoA ligase [Ignavibacteriales bacterium]